MNRTTRSLIPIEQTACGELTGSISGDVWCYGWAVHDGVCVYLSMGGPRMAVEAIRARMAKGDIVNCVSVDGRSVELTAGAGNTGRYTAYLQNIAEARFTSVILCHERVVQPLYSELSTTWLFHLSDEQARARLRHHVTGLVSVAVFREWTDYLWQAGHDGGLLCPTRSAGGVRLYTVTLDASAWTRIITDGLAVGRIRLPS